MHYRGAYNDTRRYAFSFSKLILAGGLPRSGTTLLAEILDSHPNIALAFDTGMSYECGGLYFFRWNTGLVQEMRTRQVSRIEAQRHLAEHLIKDSMLWGVKTSPKTRRFPRVGPSAPPLCRLICPGICGDPRYRSLFTIEYPNWQSRVSVLLDGSLSSSSCEYLLDFRYRIRSGLTGSGTKYRSIF
jgi:hypothetical protein